MTLDELIEELEQQRQIFGGDIPVRIYDCNTKQIKLINNVYEDDNEEVTNIWVD